LLNISNHHGKIVLSTFAVSGHIRKDGYAGTSDENTQSIALLLEFISTSQDTFKFFTAGDLYSKQESLLVVKNPELENVQLISKFLIMAQSPQPPRSCLTNSNPSPSLSAWEKITPTDTRTLQPFLNSKTPKASGLSTKQQQEKHNSKIHHRWTHNNKGL
jgi:hypothetical protein